MPNRKDDDHDDIVGLKKWKNQMELDASYKKGSKDKGVRICGLATSAILLCLSALGKLSYDHLNAVTAGVKAFWAAWGNGSEKS